MAQELASNEKEKKHTHKTGVYKNYYSMFQGIITKNFEEFGIDDKDIGYIGLAMSISCAMVATIISILVAKKLRTKLKMTIICLLSAGAFFFFWLSLICQDYIPYR